MQQFICVAELARPHGLCGELEIRSHSGEYDHIRSLEHVTVQRQSRSEEQQIEVIRGSGKKHIVKFRGIDTRERAEEFVGAQVLIPREEARPCLAHEYYYADLVNCRVRVAGNDMGRVLSVWQSPAHDMLEICLNSGRTAHVPLLEQFVSEVSVDEEYIELCSEWILSEQ